MSAGASLVDLHDLDLGLCVRVDEGDVDALAPAGGDEEELVPFRHFLLDDGGGDRREQVALERSLQRPRAELRAEALLDEERVRRLVDLDRPRPAAEPAPRERVGELLVEESPHRGALERPEDDDAVEAVAELGTERALDRALDPGAREPPVGRLEAEPGAARERGAEVRGEDDDAASEVDDASLQVGETPVVEDLQEDVPDRLRRLLELVEQDHGERLLANRGDERGGVGLRRRVGEQPLERLRRAVLAHVEPHEAVRRAEEELGERLRDLGLAGSGRADEEEDAERPRRDP